MRNQLDKKEQPKNIYYIRVFKNQYPERWKHNIFLATA